jgi:hypothetical protein
MPSNRARVGQVQLLGATVSMCLLALLVPPAAKAADPGPVLPGPSVATVKADIRLLEGALVKPTEAGLGRVVNQSWTHVNQIKALSEDMASIVPRELLVKWLTKLRTAETKWLDMRTSNCKGAPMKDVLVTARYIRRGVAAERILALTPEALGKYRDRINACLRLKLSVSSYFSQPKLGYNIHVDIQIPLDYSMTSDTFFGEGPITKVAVTVPQPESCTMTLTYTPGTFSIQHLGIALDDAGSITDITLDKYSISTASTNEDYHGVCQYPPDSMGHVSPPFPVQSVLPSWGMMYFMTHSAYGDLDVTGWQLGKAKAIAIRAFNREGPEVMEGTDFFLTRR